MMIKILLFYILSYIYLFNPGISMLSLASLRLLYPFVFIWILTKTYWIKKYLSLFKGELLIFCIVVTYCVFRSATGGDLIFLKDLITIVFDSFIISFFWIYYYEKFKINQSVYGVFYAVAIIASIISLILFLNPPLNDIVKNNFYLADADAGFLRFRCFGIAAGLTFDYSIIIGIALCFCLVKEKKIYEYLLIPIFILVSLLSR